MLIMKSMMGPLAFAEIQSMGKNKLIHPCGPFLEKIIALQEMILIKNHI